MLEFKPQYIEGLYLIDNFVAQDERGLFIKTMHEGKFLEIGFADKFRESYYSTSAENVIRGMHFQIPPYEHEKLVYVTSGRILDVVLDLRKKSKTYGMVFSKELTSFGSSIFIPKGCAHGFLALTKEATVIYNVTTAYNPDADRGILYSSLAFDWGVNSPIVSQRDLNFPGLSTFESPF